MRSVVSLQSVPYGEPIPENWPDLAKQLMDDELRGLRGLEDVEREVSVWRAERGARTVQ